MPKIDIDHAPTGHGTGYPEEFAAPCKSRRRWRLGDAVGLDQFGVNLLRLPAGAWSSQRHWHSAEDEFVWVVEGEVVLEKGAEMGRFLLGSTVVMLFPKDVLRFGSDWAPGGSVRMGEPMARAKSSAPSDGAPAPGDAP